MFKYTLVVCTADKSFSPSPPAVFNEIRLVAVYDDHCPAAVAHIAHVAPPPARVDTRYSIPLLLLLLLCVSFVTCSLTTLVTGRWWIVK